MLLSWVVVWVTLVLLAGRPLPAQTSSSRPLPSVAKEAKGENDPARLEQARQWISKSIEAYGGNDRLTAITDISFVSRSTGQDGQPIQFKVYIKGTDKFRSEVTGSSYFAITIANGPNAWLKSDQTLIELAASDVEGLRLSTLLQAQPYAIFDRLSKFWVQEERLVEGAKFLIIGVSGFLGTHYTRGEISLEPQTFLIRRFEYEEEVESRQSRGVVKRDLHYDAYQAVSGIQLPARVTSVLSGVKSTSTFAEIKINSGIPESFFEKPSKGSGQ